MEQEQRKERVITLNLNKACTFTKTYELEHINPVQGGYNKNKQTNKKPWDIRRLYYGRQLHLSEEESKKKKKKIAILDLIFIKKKDLAEEVKVTGALEESDLVIFELMTSWRRGMFRQVIWISQF